eukprot:CAMPEP_0175078088 /NCGR_PEP_ID=MMETSP0052_2-20121109/23869_1 /TAXON_ID=51329 ORGANISM="Polytomella parva, Strain SAG 63-3" /NCGR_SAMPLE_ID=MMETSP0052_2 /ASSEMBLY_ACC=CAM_ASM_000194 /LENGTH=77 /DNA_ID=CAMNT_0016347861 /DNA_START=1216 /DNA_END=1449 /DNA_ORIENTATION=+
MRDLEATASAATHFLSYVFNVDDLDSKNVDNLDTKTDKEEDERKRGVDEKERAKPFFIGKKIRICDIPQVGGGLKNQ